MTIHQFRQLTLEAKLETLFQQSQESEALLPVLKREVYYLKNRFDDFKRKQKKKEKSHAS